MIVDNELSNFEFISRFITIILIGYYFMISSKDPLTGVMNGVLYLVAIGFMATLEKNAILLRGKDHE